MFIRVDFPDPEAPMIATNSPLATVSETPRRASTRVSPMVNTLRMFFRTMVSMSPPLIGRGAVGERC